MRRATIAIVLGLVLAGGFWVWHHHPAHPSAVNASRYETDMTEGLVRGILTELKPPVPPVCFLAFGDGSTPPSLAFIARFADSQPAVRSCGSAAAPPTGEYFETSTGRPGLVVRIISFKEFISGTFDVLVGFSNLPPGHNQFTYRVSNVAGEWKIESRKPA
jgi:hypothetical protein